MRRVVLLKMSFLVVLLLLIMLHGGQVVHYYFAAPQLVNEVNNAIQSRVYNEAPKENIESSNEYAETNVADLISIKQFQDVSTQRVELITFLWGEPELPLSLPASSKKECTDNRYDDIASLQKIEKLVIAMEFGLESHVYHFIPTKPNNRVILYHQGHRGDFYNSKKQITKFIENGYSVIAFSMPLLGFNNRPSIQLPTLGTLKLSTHEQMKFLSPDKGHPIKYFLEPVVIAINYLEKNFDYSSVSMVGISGGGWTTTLVAAVDTRIVQSFPVAGSYPIYLRSNSRRDWGDYEQTVPELYNTVNYLELYILGAHGEKRKQLQIINQYDSSCFAGTKWKTYKDVVRSRVQELKAGEFDLFLDSSHKGHFVSNVAMDRILNEIEKNQAVE